MTVSDPAITQTSPTTKTASPSVKEELKAPKERTKPVPERISDTRTPWKKLLEWLRPGPDSHDELMDSVADAHENAVIDEDSKAMLEGVIGLSKSCAGDVMVPSARVDRLNIDDAYEDLLYQVIDTGHSRFPVFEGDKDNIIGILLAKDLLKLQRAPELNLRALLRPPVFVPESKPLDDLLREFRGNRNHLAIVIDEFGRTAGLVTIEDVLEEIVGEIEDEFDIAEDEGDIFALHDKTYRVSGNALIERVNEAFEVQVATDDELEQFDTIGGLVAHRMGHVPRRGEHHQLGPLHLAVMHSKGGAVKWFKVTLTAAPFAAQQPSDAEVSQPASGGDQARSLN